MCPEVCTSDGCKSLVVSRNHEITDQWTKTYFGPWLSMLALDLRVVYMCCNIWGPCQDMTTDNRPLKISSRCQLFVHLIVANLRRQWIGEPPNLCHIQHRKQCPPGLVRWFYCLIPLPSTFMRLIMQVTDSTDGAGTLIEKPTMAQGRFNTPPTWGGVASALEVCHALT